MKKFNSFKSKWLLVPLVLFTLNVSSAWGDVVCYTLTPTSGTNNSYTGNCDVDVTDDDNNLTVTWYFEGNSQTTCWRMGGKKLTSATTRTMYSKTTAIPDNVTYIEIDLGAIDEDYLTCSKCSLVVSTAANAGGTQTSKLEITSGISANGTLTFTRPAGKDWTGKFYKFMFVMTTDNVNTNRKLEICEIRFYKAVASCGTNVAIGTASLNGTFL